MSEAIEWLLENAGPTIRFRTLVDLVNEQDVGLVSHALDEMIGSPSVQEWLSRLKPDFEFDAIHSAESDAYENVMGKLVMLGMRAGLQPFDNKTLSFRVWLTENTPSTAPHTIFYQTIIAAFLSYAGYGDTSPVANALRGRLAALYSFARQPDFSSIYVDKSLYNGIPKTPSYQEAGLVNPELHPDKQFVLPWLHDIRGIAFCGRIMNDATLRRRAEEVVKMILLEEYQSLPMGYGMGRYGERYYMIGWSMKLPGFQTEPEGKDCGSMILNLEMLARYDSARESEWFVRCLEFLEGFRTDSGTYLFPQTWLPEKKTGYWVGANRMGLGENRRSKTAIECESTFWMLWIKHLANLL